MNRVFPNWISADLMIRGSITDTFGVYCFVPDEKLNGVVIFFLHPDTINLVPEEDVEKFKSIYYTFSDWFQDELDINNALTPLYNEPLDQDTLIKIVDTLNPLISKYNSENIASAKDILLACLGIREIFIIPEKLRKSLKKGGLLL